MSSPLDPSDAVDLLVEMIQNACVNTGDPDSGGEIRSVRTIQRYLGEEGTIVEPRPGRASVIYRIPGTDPDAPVLLLIPHLDVVPAKASDWRYDPFGGVRTDGYVWGRGAVDMLNVTAAMVVVFRAIRDGLLHPPRGDVILAAVADEEGGGAYGAINLVENHWPLVACDYVLTEVAGPRIGLPGAQVIPVTVAEKGPAWRHVTSRGIAGHGSQPYLRSNAVLTISEVFHRIGSQAQPVVITDEWMRSVKYLPVSDDLAQRLMDANTLDAAIDEIATTDSTLARWIHACTHLTFSPNTISGGGKINVVPDWGEGDIDIRLLPGQDASDIDDHLRKILGPDLYEQIEVEPVLEMEANGSRPEGPLWEAMADASEIHTGIRDLAPTMTPVTTDARFFRAKGIPAYGVGLFDTSTTFAEMLAMFHGVDERVSERSVELTTEFLATVIERFGERLPGR
ncbi:MAG: M20/M25/M40 family metallo-hydrolase [Acidimicrobiia bacterium]|nr:M20/M25/M40 family metallo-hydrolase [Acidimicrobiia bacterium]